MKIMFPVIVLFLLVPFANHAGDAPPGDAAFLFAYQPKAGQRAQFDAGYRQHLEWHRENNDPLPWYGWYVATGERTGTFVDGSFGITFAAFDNRVRPAEDAANFRETTAPYADPAYRRTLRWMPRLGTSNRLENRNPSPRIEVLTYLVRPGKTALFESCLERLAIALNEETELAVYRQLAGGAQPAYLLMFPHDGNAWFDTGTVLLDELIEANFEKETTRKLLAILAESVQEIRSETWRYRRDLSYFPAE